MGLLRWGAAPPPRWLSAPEACSPAGAVDPQFLTLPLASIHPPALVRRRPQAAAHHPGGRVAAQRRIRADAV